MIDKGILVLPIAHHNNLIELKDPMTVFHLGKKGKGRCLVTSPYLHKRGENIMKEEGKLMILTTRLIDLLN